MKKLSWLIIALAVFGGFIFRCFIVAMILAGVLVGGLLIWNEFGPEIQAMLAEPVHLIKK